MGEAKRKSATQSNVIYHHSSILVTNRIWMDGVLKPDGLGTDIIQHPKIEGGVRFGGEKVRRACQDFPPLVWFTTQIAMPKCMQSVELTLRFPNSVQDEGKLREELDQFITGLQKITPADMSNFRTWNRVALGFPIADIRVIRWRDYHGYDSPEGRDLNASAMEANDNPDDWYVSEPDIDVMKIAEFWSSPSVSNPRLKRIDNDYIGRIRKMVKACQQGRANGSTVYIPPAWMDLASSEKQHTLSQALGVPVVNF